jgi:predicted glycosyltransferase
LEPEWQRKNVLPALKNLYDDIWVYGLPQICDPLAEISLPKAVREKVTFTGYLRRTEMTTVAKLKALPIRSPYVLVTAGGGGDGEALIDWVLKAYEHEVELPHPALLVLGPFMQSERQAEFLQRAARLPKIHAITFDAHMETLMARALGVIAMGGYNTFCEILSFDKRAIVVPRRVPRMEQYIRAERAQKLGLISMLLDDDRRDPKVMANAIRRLPSQRLPSEVVVPGLLDGLENVNKLVRQKLAARRHAPRLRLAARSA